jgi:hypothetical protein
MSSRFVLPAAHVVYQSLALMLTDLQTTNPAVRNLDPDLVQAVHGVIMKAGWNMPEQGVAQFLHHATSKITLSTAPQLMHNHVKTALYATEMFLNSYLKPFNASLVGGGSSGWVPQKSNLGMEQGP